MAVVQKDEMSAGWDGLDRMVRYVVAAYLVVSASNFLFSSFLIVSFDVSPLFWIFPAVGLALFLVLAVLVVRGVVWPLGGLCALALLAFVAARLWASEPPAIGGWSRTNFLHTQVVVVLVIWACVRLTGYYRERKGVRGLFLVVMTVAVLSLVPGGMSHTWDQLSRTVFKPGPAEESVGRQVGTLHFETRNGLPVTLDDPQKIYIVDFWTPRCGPCIREMPELVKLQKELESSPVAELHLVLTKRSSAELLAPLPPQAKSTDFLFDSEQWARKLGVTGYPTKVFLRDGRILDVVVGSDPDVCTFLKTKLERLSGVSGLP